MIKLIVSDIDGTLIKNSFSKNPYFVSKENKEAIKKLRDNDITFCLATGRNHASAENVMEKIRFKMPIISQNGTYLINSRGHQISENAFDPDQSLKIIKLLTNEKIDFTLTGPNTVAFDTFSDNKITPYIVDVNAGGKYLLSHKILNEFDIHAHRVGTISVIPSQNQDFEKIEKMLHKNIDNSKFDVVKSSEWTLDIVLKNISKANAILKLCEELMITPDQVAVIGDNYNDLPMFKVFKNSYVINTSDPKLKKFAKHEVGEVHEAIEHILGGK